MEVEVTNKKVVPKDSLTYPVFMRYGDGDVYMFLSPTHALIIEHSNSEHILEFTEDMNIHMKGWSVVENGYQINLTQYQ